MCAPLRDDGVSYGDYLEQLTYLIFLKMSDEYSKPPYKKITGIPEGYTWSDMNTLKGAELEEQYKKTLETLAQKGGILGQIFSQASNKISNGCLGLGTQTLHHSANQGTGRKILTRTTLDIFCVLLE